MDTSEAQCRDIILDSINEGVFTVDLDWRVTSFNQAAERITGVLREDAIGQQCCDVFRANICEGACALKQAMVAEEPVVNTTVYMLDVDGKEVPVRVSACALRDQQGRIIGGVETFQDLRQVKELRKKLEATYTFEDIVGQSQVMRDLFALLPQLSDSHSSVLITGASGTGKELVARAIHNLSSRRENRFIALNCGALPDTLLESELFGYKAGAFTDAKQDKLGRFALADEGTLFLDEIGDISPAMQVRLLRVLQEHTFEPLGGIESVPTNVRIIAATNKNLSDLVKKEKFREDLFYRINVIHVELPNLRARKEDIPLLVDYFIGRFNMLQGKDIAGLSHATLAILMEHDYPGNVRELENIIEHAFVLCQGGLIMPQNLPANLRDKSPSGLPVAMGGMKLKSMETAMIIEALRQHAGNRTLAAKDLGIDASTLYRKIKSLNIQIPETDGRNTNS